MHASRWPAARRAPKMRRPMKSPLRRWLLRIALALLVLLVLGGGWLWFVYLEPLYFPADGGPHRHVAGSALAGATENVDGALRALPGCTDGLGAAARLHKPIRLAKLDERTIVFADINNHAVRTLASDGTVKTLVGGPDQKGHADGPAATAQLDSPHGVAVRADGAIAVADLGSNSIRLLTPAGDSWTVSTFAGVPGPSSFADGAAATARFNAPHAVAWAPDGSLFVADIGNARVRRVANGQVSTVAGDGHWGSADGFPGRLVMPMDLALAGDGTLWIADCGSLTLRTWHAERGLATPFPQRPKMSMPHGVSLWGRRVVVAEMSAQRVVALDPADGSICTLYGDGTKGLGTNQLYRPAAVLVDGDRLWIADLYNHRIVLGTLPPQ